MKESKESKEVESFKEVPGKHDVDPALGDHHDIPSRATVPECFATATGASSPAPRAPEGEKAEGADGGAVGAEGATAEGAVGAKGASPAPRASKGSPSGSNRAVLVSPDKEIGFAWPK